MQSEKRTVASTQVTRPSLLIRIRDSADFESWSRFVDIYAPLIHDFARKKGLQEADAADVTQDVLRQVQPAVSANVPSTGRPDLAVVDIRTEYNTSAASFTGTPRITAALKNVGESEYRSDRGWQVFVLYKNGDLLAQCSFNRLSVGERLSLSVEGQPEAAVYEARIVYAKGIERDGNPRNDDANPTNDSLIRNMTSTAT